MLGVSFTPKSYCSPRGVFGEDLNFKSRLVAILCFCVTKAVSFSLQNPIDDLPWLGGTNPYPLAPTITPLVSALFGGGPGGNSTGPERKIILVKNFESSCKLSII